MKLTGLTLPELNDLEWIATNGLGGYASSTMTGCNTRRYHGLLVALDDPPAGRRVHVSKIEEQVICTPASAIALSTNQYSGAIHPEGYRHLVAFEPKPLPRFVFEFPGGSLEKTVFMVQGSNTTVAEYVNTGPSNYELVLNLLLTDRDYHSLYAPRDDAFRIVAAGPFRKIYTEGDPVPVCIAYSKGTWTDRKWWYRNFEYKQERDRGFDYMEDTYNAGQVTVSLEPGDAVSLILTTDEQYLSSDPAALKLDALRYADRLRKWGDHTFLNDLAEAADQFVIERRSTGSRSLIAGYHWFADWGRDTMIAMRGICIAQGDREAARSIISTFLKYLDRGMLPNRFPDRDGGVDYNTIDATLWLFIACYEYHKKFNDEEFVKETYPLLTEIIEAHIAGTRYDIHMTAEGLLSGGSGLAQLTWMDARTGDHVITPRHGCPVEVNMLWYNALKIHQDWSTIVQNAKPYNKAIKSFEKNFKTHFINDKGYLNDVVIPGVSADDRIRPNQIYAVSLPFTVLTKPWQKKITAFVQEHLLTGYGLRTLDSQDPEFRPLYEGDAAQRDSAYHQGTVWPFLSGEFFTAYLKVNNYNRKSKEQVMKWIEPLRQHFYQDACLHGISEIFDGGEPLHGKGAIHQAWSVSALLKVLLDMKEIS